MAGFFRNIEGGVMSKNSELLSELKHFFNEAWTLGKSYREVRDQLEVDAVTLETVSWAKIQRMVGVHS